jgi:hypothetical protein
LHGVLLVLLIWNFNDTILQLENASVFPKTICGNAALCYMGREKK